MQTAGGCRGANSALRCGPGIIIKPKHYPCVSSSARRSSIGLRSASHDSAAAATETDAAFQAGCSTCAAGQEELTASCPAQAAFGPARSRISAATPPSRRAESVAAMTAIETAENWRDLVKSLSSVARLPSRELHLLAMVCTLVLLAPGEGTGRPLPPVN